MKGQGAIGESNGCCGNHSINIRYYCESQAFAVSLSAPGERALRDNRYTFDLTLVYPPCRLYVDNLALGPLACLPACLPMGGGHTRRSPSRWGAKAPWYSSRWGAKAPWDSSRSGAKAPWCSRRWGGHSLMSLLVYMFIQIVIRL